MADIKLFKFKPQVKEMKAASVLLEKELQTVIENNMQEFLALLFWQANMLSMAAEWTVSVLMKIIAL